jgi:hypothetical protein
MGSMSQDGSRTGWTMRLGLRSTKHFSMFVQNIDGLRDSALNATIILGVHKQWRRRKPPGWPAAKLEN